MFPECLDERTIHQLHVRMPAHSAHDVFHIGEQLQLSAIFPTARDEGVKSLLLERIQSCERVLTFKSFHADMVLLEGCYNPLRQLWPKSNVTLREACKSSFDDGGGGNFESSYLDVWLYSIRIHPKFSWPIKAELKKVGSKIASRFAEVAVAELANFAASRGFSSEMIEVARTGGYYGEQNDPIEGPILSGARHEVRLQDRCGRPSEALFDSCWGQLTRKNILTERDKRADRHATPFAVARNFVRCLFELEQPFEAQTKDTFTTVRWMAGGSRPLSSILVRPGRSSTLLASTVNSAAFEVDGDTKPASQVRRSRPAAAYRTSTPSHQPRPRVSENGGKAGTADHGEEVPSTDKEKLSLKRKLTMAPTSARVKKNRQRSTITVRPEGRGLRTLRLVEDHCVTEKDRDRLKYPQALARIGSSSTNTVN